MLSDPKENNKITTSSSFGIPSEQKSFMCEQKIVKSSSLSILNFPSIQRKRENTFFKLFFC